MGREAVLRSLTERKHTEKGRVEIGPVKRNGILERSMAKTAILISEDKELASQQERVYKAAGMACREGVLD